MPNVFGRDCQSVGEILEAFQRHGDAIRCPYRVRYGWSPREGNPYRAPILERPEALRGNPPDVVFPWEQVLVAAATCVGSDYPMLAAYRGIALSRVDLVLACEFDPRGEFDGLGGFVAPPETRGCYLSLHLHTTLVSPAPRAELEAIHEHAVTKNMVLGALRGFPRTHELVIENV